MTPDQENKLNTILALLGSTAVAVGGTAAIIKNNIMPTLTPENLSNQAAAGVCKSTKPGGCMNKALSDQSNDIGNAIKNNGNDLLNKLNAGANAAQLGLLNIMNAKLGPQLPGGIGTFLDTFFKGFNKLTEWMHLDRVLNILNTVMMIQMVYFMCDSVKVVTLQMISDGLSVIGINDKDGQPLNLGKILDNTIEDILKQILGVEELEGFKKEWKALNRIYQAASNILFAVQNMMFSVLTALEIIGSWQADIGNALKKYLVVGQQAFAWMNPNPNFHNAFFTFLGNALNIVSSIDFVAQSILQGRQAIDTFDKQKTDLTKSMAEAADGFQPPAHKATTDAAAKSAVDSRSPVPSLEDIQSLIDQ